MRPKISSKVRPRTSRCNVQRTESHVEDECFYSRNTEIRLNGIAEIPIKLVARAHALTQAEELQRCQRYLSKHESTTARPNLQ